LYQKPGGRLSGTEKGLHWCATLAAHRCHLDDVAIGINRHDRDYAAVGEEDMIERSVYVQQYLPPLAVNELEVGHKPLEVTRWEGEQKPVAEWM
jgi:hypothetical protein